MATSYQSRNRIHYAEPTEINKAGVNGYQSPLEDFCISVDLSIIYGTRRACGMGSENGELKELKYSSDNGTISFFNGTNGTLTANYADITPQKPWENTRECIGIKSIDISYDTLLYPQVVIKFTDIRGASLMNSQELKSNYNTGEGSFYSMLYSTPSPIYKLTVKGFYGKPVIYRLTMSKTELSFDAATGNFDITVNFIGEMYGVYADIPMTYLAVAPYIDTTGINHWLNETSETGRFRFRNGGTTAKMLTYPELRLAIAQAAESEEKVNLDEKRDADNISFNQKIASVQQLYETYPFPCEDDGERWEEFPSSSIVCHISEYKDMKKKVGERVAAFKSILDSYNEENADEKISGFNYVSAYEEGNGIARYHFKKEDKTQQYAIVDSDSFYEKNQNLVNRKLFERNHGECAEYYVYLIDKGSLAPFNGGKVLLDKLQELRKKQDELKREYEKEENQVLVNALGFPPTIRNLYMMAFAHMETFIRVFYECTRRIDEQLNNHDDARKISHYGISSAMTDCYGEELPPFPSLYAEKNIENTVVTEEIWPGGLENSNDLIEINLVECIINAARLYTKKEEEVANAITQSKVEDINDEDIDKEYQAIDNSEKLDEAFESNDLRLSIYMTLKSLYNKWLCLIEEKRWKVVSDKNASTTFSDDYSESDFKNFLYIDSFYHDVGDELMINVQSMMELMARCMPSAETNPETNFSLLSYLMEVAQKNGGNLMALPVQFGCTDEDSMKTMFTAIPYLKQDLKLSDTSTYVFLYPYEMSKNLNGASQFEDDGFVFTDNDGKLSDDAIPVSLQDETGHYVGAFGVTYARQNQAFFKNIGLNMTNPGVTEASIAGTMNIASAAAINPRETTLYGQDIYRVYSSYMFECSVEMLGNAQIMPIMYFQLNGIPMWRGAYMIKKVTHNITPGNMTTSFSGYRVNKNAIPMVMQSLTALSEGGWATKDSNSEAEENASTEEKSINKPYIEVSSSISGADKMEECVQALYDSWEGAGYNKFNTSSNRKCIGGVYRLAQMYQLNKSVRDVLGLTPGAPYKVGQLKDCPEMPTTLKEQLEKIGYKLKASTRIFKDGWKEDSSESIAKLKNSSYILKMLGVSPNVGDIIGYFPVKNKELYNKGGHWHAAIYKGVPSEKALEGLPDDKKKIARGMRWASDFRQSSLMVYDNSYLKKADYWACYLFSLS